MAVQRLLKYKHPVVAVGIKKGNIEGVEIQNNLPKIENVDTVTLYLGPKNQVEYYDYVFSLNPRRVIFNPGTYNLELIEQLEKREIECVDACTLVMLSAGTY
jgi:hypothetical protein